MKIKLLTPLLCAGACLVAFESGASDFLEQYQLIASDGRSEDQFGSSVAVQGNLVVVGALTHDVNAANSGAAYIFELSGAKGTLTEVAKLVVSDGTSGDLLGQSVAVDGDLIVVGADRAYSNSQGRAYVYEKPPGGWAGVISESAQLRASNRGSNDLFGTDVAIEGSTIVVGAVGEDEASGAAGALYVFEEPLTGWSGILQEDAKLIPSVSQGNNGYLGRSVAIEGDVIVSGAFLGSVDGNDDQGRAYVYVRPEMGWNGTLTETAELLASDGQNFDRLGVGVGISGSTIVLGAYQWEAPGPNSNHGAVYVYEKPSGGWEGKLFESARLISSEPVSGELLGTRVAIDNNTVVAGTDKDGTNARESVYVFSRPQNGWSGEITETQRLEDDVSGENSFGLWVALDSGLIVAGARQDDLVDTNAGRVYVYVTQGVFSDGFEAFPP